ncbi:MAG: alginate export family protein [Methylobacter sp.]|uniref:alginate export family protein n=1 Tax=Methylobacter sp. TaxID=2051955 RepID=UPI002727CF59|nr:alginate export family protein [Methylobacter sp.]MDO9270868.1 alginate export family protein [Methylobacter sp.]MDP1664655.1 alginate export family protein [Methylobacter sp.]
MPQKKTKHPLSSASLLALSVVSGSALADINQKVEDALNFYHYGKNGAVKFDLNTRWENVDQDRGPQKTANAVTSRLRAGLLSPVFHGIQGYAEYEGNLAMVEDFNSLRNGNTGYSTIPDPEKSELNQLWISYAGIPDTLIKGGRQRIKLDDDRFIGNVGWRQMETTFDSVLLTHNNQQIFGLTVNAGYIGNVQTFTATNEHIEAPILNVNYKVGDYGNLVAYGYWLDYTERENYEKSSQTYGLRMSNWQKPGDSLKLSDNYGLVYTAEWGHQEDYGHGATNYDTDRINLMGGFTAYNFTFQGAVEQLDGKGVNKTFDTPLGTNHAFQGWADLFLVTPRDGIRDVSGAVFTTLDRGSVVLSGIYHDFTDDTGRFHYGKEYDFSALKKFGKHYSVLAKYAYYDANTFGGTTDTQKIWIQGNINF